MNTLPFDNTKEGQERRAELTSKTIRRIAELRIKALGLKISVDEYLKRCQGHGK